MEDEPQLMHVLYRLSDDDEGGLGIGDASRRYEVDASQVPADAKRADDDDEALQRFVRRWSCSCRLEGAAAPAGAASRALVVFIYAEAEEALRGGFPFAADLEVSQGAAAGGPLRREDAERRRIEERRLHRLLQTHVPHRHHHRSRLLRCDESVEVAYARKTLRLPLPRRMRQRPEDDDCDEGEDGDGAVRVAYVREDHEIVPHGQVWQGSIEMARWICAHYHDRFAAPIATTAATTSHRPRALELGSGCGLPGIVLAALGAQVTLSDRSDGALANLVRNVRANASLFAAEPPAVVHLDWSEPESMRPVSSAASTTGSCADAFDYIVGTEVVYSEEGAEHLIATIDAWLAPRTTASLGAQQATFYLLQNPLRAGLKHFVDVLARRHSKEERPRLLLEELDSEYRRLHDSVDGEEQELRLYRVTREA